MLAPMRYTVALGILLSGTAAIAQTAQTPGTAAVPQTILTDTTSGGFHAGDFVVRLRAIGVIPQDSSTSVSVIGGHVNVSDQAAPEIDLSYFFTDHIAAEVIAASTRHGITVNGSTLGHVDVGNTYILPPTLTAQYHFQPHGVFDPYLGVGLTVAFWYDTNAGGGPVTKLGLSTTAGPAIQAGFNVALGGPWFANFDVKQVFLDTEARLNNGAIVAKTSLNPTIIGAGIGYRF